MPALRLVVTLALLVAAASSCAAPLQNGGVVMSPGAEARLDLMCRYRADGSGAAEVCATSTDE
jgi:hypothetical protein